MKTIKMQCKNCGGNLEFETDMNREFIFCRYCGEKLLVDKEETTLNYNDGARIKEAEVQESINKMTLDAIVDDRRRTHLLIVLGVEWGLIVIIGIVIFCLLK